TSGKTFGFGYLADKASKLPLPEDKDLILKTDEEFKLITKSTSIYDLTDIVTGKAQYGLDMAMPTASVAVISRPPVPGDELISFESKNALAITGVQKVFSIEPAKFPVAYNALGGVVVVADNTWAAIKGRDALEIEWGAGPNRDYNSSTYKDDLVNNTKKKGKVQRSTGDIYKSLKEADKKVVADYYVPHYAHTPMETPCAIANVDQGVAELWVPTQAPQWTRWAVSEALDLEMDNVTMHVTLLGGGFGRKSKPDFAIEAALISKECGRPVKLLWTREDDVKNGLYHACCAQHLEVSIDENNKVSGWLQRAAMPSINANEDASLVHPADYELGQGMLDLPYDIPNISCESVATKAKTRIGWMRSVANINHGFAIGSFMDEIASARELDPIDNVLDLLGDDRKIDLNSMVKNIYNYNESFEEFPWDTGRFRRVIESVREQSNWNTKTSKGSGLGFAAHRSFLTYVACVVEVKVEGDKIEIPNVYYSVDCGIAVNPDRIKSQFEGGAVFATSMLLNEITMKNGIVEQENFHDYPLARMSSSPKNIDVRILESKEKPTGVGEPPVPPLAPALCNAIYNATGKRIRSLPVKLT
ncbi:MAG: xanthine dehydrogenase family protein molybdopterin-binding subunit, partial [Cytophagales bacterium]|nr:xanthine dehydrogenase family protein molybdopterin-binding subunit [Cytophagales bacterium]